MEAIKDRRKSPSSGVPLIGRDHSCAPGSGGAVEMRGHAVRARSGYDRTPFELGIPLGALTMVVAALIDSAAVAPRHEGARIAVIAAAVAIFCALVGEWRSGVATALVGYLLLDGFLLNREGDLTWSHTSSPYAVAAVAVAAVAGMLAGWSFRRLSNRPPRIPRSSS
jgi:hypothetical protein